MSGAAPSLAALLLACLAAAPAGAAVVAESESNARGAPDLLPEPAAPFLTAYGNGFVVVTGELAPGDADFFGLELSQGQLLLVSLFDGGRGELTDTRIGVFDEDFASDPDPDVDPLAAPVAENDDGGAGFLSRIAVPIGATGQWKVAVTGARDTKYQGAHFEGADEPVAYRLVIAVTNGTPPVLESDLDTDPGTNNDVAGSADDLPAGGAVVRGHLAPADIDHYELAATDGDEITVSVFDLTSGTLAPMNGELSDTRVAIHATGTPPESGVVNDDGGPGFLSNALATVPASGGGTWQVALTGFRDSAFEGKHFEGPFDYALVVATGALAAPVARCDVNADAFVDRADIDAIFALRGQPASGPTDPHDGDGDGTITVLDARTCATKCGNTNCEPQPVAACGTLGLEALLALAPWAALRGRRLGRRAGAAAGNEREELR